MAKRENASMSVFKIGTEESGKGKTDAISEYITLQNFEIKNETPICETIGPK